MEPTQNNYQKIVRDNINRLIQEQSLTTKKLAEQLYIHPSNLHRKLKGETNFSIDDMGMIANILGVSIESLLSTKVILKASDMELAEDGYLIKKEAECQKNTNTEEKTILEKAAEKVITFFSAMGGSGKTEKVMEHLRSDLFDRNRLIPVGISGDTDTTH